MNNRRKLLVALGASVIAAPHASFAQQPGKVWRVGFLALRGRPDSLDSGNHGAFRQGMRELGYVEGGNLVIEWRFAEERSERLTDLAAELILGKVDVIVTTSAPTTQAAQKATANIPIVMGATGDPVNSGFVKSLARPGGNITGLSTITADLGPKYMEMLLSMVPKLSRVAVLIDPSNSAHTAILKAVEAAASRVGVRIVPSEARTPQEIDGAFSVMVREKAGAVIVNGAFFNVYGRQIAELAAKYRLASISPFRSYVEAGGLTSYGPNMADMYRRAAKYVDKIFRGANPADLPVEQPTKFELFINRKTAKTLGLTIPQSLLISADKVIE